MFLLTLFYCLVVVLFYAFKIIDVTISKTKKKIIDQKKNQRQKIFLYVEKKIEKRLPIRVNSTGHVGFQEKTTPKLGYVKKKSELNID